MTAKEQKLLEKYQEMSFYEAKISQEGYSLIAGIDEAGRGPLAGPVVAAACILDPQRPIYGLDDSKKLSEKKRELLFTEIEEKALAYEVVLVPAEEIDEINILNATKKAMYACVKNLSLQPDFILIDAVELKDLSLPYQAIIGGDSKSNSIAAASILAKVSRDRIMVEMDQRYPGYEFSRHKGYGTKVHYAALEALGLCPIHRRSFLKKLL